MFVSDNILDSICNEILLYSVNLLIISRTLLFSKSILKLFILSTFLTLT